MFHKSEKIEPAYIGKMAMMAIDTRRVRELRHYVARRRSTCLKRRIPAGRGLDAPPLLGHGRSIYGLDSSAEGPQMQISPHLSLLVWRGQPVVVCPLIGFGPRPGPFCFTQHRVIRRRKAAGLGKKTKDRARWDLALFSRIIASTIGCHPIRRTVQLARECFTAPDLTPNGSEA